MERAIALSSNNSIGCVVLRNTNHWIRGGNYGWQAVERKRIGICFTNTKPNMPAWGGTEPKLGNNPMIIAIPRKKGDLVLDMALSQYSYGKIKEFARKQMLLPYPGGLDANGNLTRDPISILENERSLPIGLWKGAGLSLILDIFASILSDGKSTHQIGQLEAEHALSQVFIAIDTIQFGDSESLDIKVDAIIEDLKSSRTYENATVRYAGENTYILRKKNLKSGIPLDQETWSKIHKYLL